MASSLRRNPFITYIFIELKRSIYLGCDIGTPLETTMKLSLRRTFALKVILLNKVKPHRTVENIGEHIEKLCDTFMSLCYYVVERITFIWLYLKIAVIRNCSENLYAFHEALSTLFTYKLFIPYLLVFIISGHTSSYTFHTTVFVYCPN